MRLIVNGEATERPDGWTLAQLVRDLTEAPRGVAVAVDREVVPRSRWEDWPLEEGASVEVLVAAAGG